MYSGEHAVTRAQQPALIMAQTGASVSYAELEVRTNRLAHLLRANGLRRLDHYAIFMENNARYIESCGAGERSGLYYTCVNSHLTPDELAFIVNSSESKVLITSEAKRGIAAAALRNCPKVRLCLVADGEGDATCKILMRRLQHSQVRRSATKPSAAQCSTHLAPRGGPRASYALCLSSRLAK